MVEQGGPLPYRSEPMRQGEKEVAINAGKGMRDHAIKRNTTRDSKYGHLTDRQVLGSPAQFLVRRMAAGRVLWLTRHVGPLYKERSG